MLYSTTQINREIEPVKREGWRRRREFVEEQEDSHQEEQGQSQQEDEESSSPKRTRIELIYSMELLDDLALFWLDEFGDPDEAGHLFPDFEDNGVAEVDYGLAIRQAESTEATLPMAPHNSSALDEVALMRLRYWSAG